MEVDQDSWRACSRSPSNDLGRRCSRGCRRQPGAARGAARKPEGWAALQNEIGYALTIAGKRENNIARFEQAVPILRDAVAVQRNLNAVPAVAYTEDSLCDVLIELGAVRKDAALVDEAIAACKSALVVFQDNIWPSSLPARRPISPKPRRSSPNCGSVGTGAGAVSLTRWPRFLLLRTRSAFDGP